MTNIIAFSARKSGGKTTSSNFLYASTLCSLGVIDRFRFGEDGLLEVSSTVSGEYEEGQFDPGHPDNQEFLQSIYIEQFGRTANKFVDIFYFADDLKQKVCIDILGLTHEQCYGSEADKNTLTHLRWEDMPGWVYGSDLNEQPFRVEIQKLAAVKNVNGAFQHDRGQMTARQVMQFVGTEIFRRMYGDVWVDSTVRRIKASGLDTAIIGDCRFPNEVLGTQKHGGKVIRLLRNPYEDNHSSETALDDFPLDKFDFVIDNRNCTIKETNKQIETYLRSIGWFPHYILPVGQAC